MRMGKRIRIKIESRIKSFAGARPILILILPPPLVRLAAAMTCRVRGLLGLGNVP
jgi:hypothetical protein